MILFQDAILKDNLTPDMGLLLAYGIYLRNGGSYDDFMDLDLDDIQILLTVDQSLERARDLRLLEGISKIVSSAFGGK